MQELRLNGVLDVTYVMSIAMRDLQVAWMIGELLKPEAAHIPNGLNMIVHSSSAERNRVTVHPHAE